MKKKIKTLEIKDKFSFGLALGLFVTSLLMSITGLVAEKLLWVIIGNVFSIMSIVMLITDFKLVEK